MELRALLARRVERSILQISLLMFGIFVLLSSIVYFTKAAKFYKSNIPVLEESERKVEKLKSFVSTAERLKVHDADPLSFARLLDNLRSTLKDPQISISEPKLVENLRALSLSIKGDARFGDLTQALKLLETERIPVVVVKSVSITKKEGAVLGYDISADVFFVGKNGGSKGK